MKKSIQWLYVCGALLTASFSANVSADGIYKWTDTQGQVNYADMVPGNINAQKIDDRILIQPRREATHAAGVKPDAGMTADNVFEPGELPATSAGLPE